MKDKTLEQALIKARRENDPTAFMRLITQIHEAEVCSPQFASQLDAIETLPLKDLFAVGRVTAMAGHSLGPLLKSARNKINIVLDLHTDKLHEGHFPDTREEGGDWYRCDREPTAIAAMRSMIGNFKDGEFVYSHKGLSDFLGEVVPTFYDPCLDDWRQAKKTGICFLGKEFLSDQKVIETTLKRAINGAIRDKAFKDIPVPTVRSLMLGMLPNADGLYTEQGIIDFVIYNASKIQILHLSDIVFSTGQRLDLKKILSALQPVIAEHQIIVGIDLAHTIGNRPIDLPGLNVTYAVMCSYKYASGSAGTGSGLYVSNTADLVRYQPIQGWVAVEDPSIAFKCIDGENSDEEPVKMYDRGAVAFTRSNPSPIAVAALQEYAKIMHEKGWKNVVAKSECLTRYMVFLLKYCLGDKIHLITPEDPEKRGAMIVFQIKGLVDVKPVENMLKQLSRFGVFDSDTRPPKNIRLTPHPGYSDFTSIFYVVLRLTEVVYELLAKQAVAHKSTSIKLKEAVNLTMFSSTSGSDNQVSSNNVTAATQPIQAKL